VRVQGVVAAISSFTFHCTDSAICWALIIIIVNTRISVFGNVNIEHDHRHRHSPPLVCPQFSTLHMLPGLVLSAPIHKFSLCIF